MINRRRFIQGFAAALATASAISSNHWTIEDCQLEWSSSLFDYNTRYGVALTITRPDGSTVRNGFSTIVGPSYQKSKVRRHVKLVNADEVAKKTLLKWAETVI